MNEQSLIWLDTETTGLDPIKDSILEIGIIITDYTGDIETVWSSVVTPYKSAQLWTQQKENLDTFVKQMHTDNGLLAAIDQCMGLQRYEMESVELEAMTFLGHHFPDMNGTLPLVGSSVHFDRAMMAVDMPHLEEWFGYRNIDISSLKELCNRINPDLAAKRPEATRKQHRVIPDLKDSIEEYQFYLHNFLFV